MPGDALIPPAGASAAAALTPTASKPPAQAVFELASSVVASERPLLNPSLHVDLALNLVVLQFIDDKGDVTSSIPSEKQLKAYRAHDTGDVPAARVDRRP